MTTVTHHCDVCGAETEACVEHPTAEIISVATSSSGLPFLGEHELISLAAAANACGDTAIEAYADIARSGRRHNGILPSEALGYCRRAVAAGRYVWSSHRGFLGGEGTAWQAVRS